MSGKNSNSFEKPVSHKIAEQPPRMWNFAVPRLDSNSKSLRVLVIQVIDFDNLPVEALCDCWCEPNWLLQDSVDVWLVFINMIKINNSKFQYRIWSYILAKFIDEWSEYICITIMYFSERIKQTKFNAKQTYILRFPKTRDSKWF